MIGDENYQYENMKLERKHRKSREEFRAEEKAKAEMYSRLITHKGKDNKMTESNVKQFASGVKISKKEGKYGSFLKVGININDFCDKNPMNDKGWVNFTIFESKEGLPYAVIDTYGTENNNVVKIAEVKDDEIPF